MVRWDQQRAVIMFKPVFAVLVASSWIISATVHAGEAQRAQAAKLAGRLEALTGAIPANYAPPGRRP